MGASTRINTLAVLCCAFLCGPQTALAEPDGWLERVASLTRSVIPDINFAAYLDRSERNRADIAERNRADIADADVLSFAGFARAETAPRSVFAGPRYSIRVVDGAEERAWNSLGSNLIRRDAAAADSRLNGLGRSAMNTKPSPMYGLDVSVSFSERWSLGMKGRILDNASSDIDTSVSAYSAAFEYAAKEQLRLGFGYEQFETYADAQLSTTSGYVSYRYSGPRVFTTLRF